MLPLLLPYCCQAPTRASETFSVGSVLSIDGHKERRRADSNRLRWRGFCTRVRTSSLSPAPNAASTWRRTPAVDVTLTEEDLMRIDEVAPKGVAAGEHYNEAFMRTVNR